jgi:hypothetical protein
MPRLVGETGAASAYPKSQNVFGVTETLVGPGLDVLRT